ncbi:DUF4349 domain-containing protein [Brevundimonas sp. A19_0]|uniref:DUF4349 domain-containing protein n=1 Tax=Brevundimonas sp. A19_0 TaxID=2821087 RepID=UPI001ADCF3FA|nr:DUF4349 domain-containing protein [Brevundimonas sp. A19_0]MBO9500116.1 DUF4349 domain-containing protein [Brevundimonas sp. A19_0]
MRRTMMLGALAIALGLSACDGSGSEGAAEYADTDMAMAEPVIVMPQGPTEATDAAATSAEAGGASSGAPAPEVQPVSTIAYSYRYALDLPADEVNPMRSRHEAACVEAGPRVCQILGSESQAYGDDRVSATLRVRATPAWLTTFRARLEGQADDAGGRIASSQTDAEDLSRSLTDTEARLRALETLRDRLQQLLATRSGPLEQLLQTERELARVQGELDATRSALAVLRDRVAMSQLTITYQSETQFASNSAFSPVGNAFANSLRVFMATLGGLIYLVAGLLPLALILLPVGWLVRRWVRVRRERRPPPPLD